MAKRKKKPLSFAEKLRQLREAGIEPYHRYRQEEDSFDADQVEPLPARIGRILDFLRRPRPKNADTMYYFILYDITDDRIRNYIAKYLLERGCIRIQKSVYMAHLQKSAYIDMHETLREVNDLYDNEDSIIFIPLDEFHVEMMKMVGKNVDVSMVVDPPNTLFF